MKNRFVIGAGVLLLFLLGVGIFILNQNGGSLQSNITADTNTQQDENFSSHDTAAVTSTPVTLAPTDADYPQTASEVAMKFYKYYFSYPENPLSGGRYAYNQYLSNDFKDVIHDLYKNGDTPIFCIQNRRPDIIVGQEKQVYYDEAYVTQVVISEAPPGKQDLYRVLLQNLSGKWQIYDINCIY